MISIRTNTSAMVASRYLSLASQEVARSTERLATGRRINRAADDAAGLAISTGLQSQIRGMSIAIRNTQDAVSVTNTMDSALSQTTAILQEMRDLAVSAANRGSGAAAATAQFKQLVTQLDDIANKTVFNGTKLLDGTYQGSFQVGANAGDTASVVMTTASITGLGAVTGGDGSGITGLTAAGLNLGALNLNTQSGARAAIDAIDEAIQGVSTVGAYVGAKTNSMDRTVSNLTSQVENLSAADQRIMDIDVAAETANLAKNQILAQTSAAMLAQAHANQSSVLRILLGF